MGNNLTLPRNAYRVSIKDIANIMIEDPHCYAYLVDEDIDKPAIYAVYAIDFAALRSHGKTRLSFYICHRHNMSEKEIIQNINANKHGLRIKR